MLHAASAGAGIPTASLRASVHHYVAAAPNPKAALALVRHLEQLVGVNVDAGELESAAGDYERQVNLAVQSDPDVQDRKSVVSGKSVDLGGRGIIKNKTHNYAPRIEL